VGTTRCTMLFPTTLSRIAHGRVTRYPFSPPTLLAAV